MGLRLAEGMSLDRFEELTGLTIETRRSNT